jgi:hypothetical protein
MQTMPLGVTMWASGILPVCAIFSQICTYCAGKRSLRICSSWNSPYSPRPLVTLNSVWRSWATFWMSAAFSFMAPMSWSTPSSFQLVAMAPLTASGSIVVSVFSIFPDIRCNKISIIAEKTVTTATSSSIIRVTIGLNVYSNCGKNSINDYEFTRNILNVNDLLDFC